MTANQRQLTTKTKATPAPIPAVRIKSGTAMGKVSVPAKRQDQHKSFFKSHRAQNHSFLACSGVLVLSWGVLRSNSRVMSRVCSPSAATALIG